MMAALDNGIEATWVTETEVDANPSRELKKKLEHFFHYLHSKEDEKIPLGLVGSGKDAYFLYEQAYHRGKFSPRVSTLFKDICLRYGTDTEHFIKKKYRDRMDRGGIRFASLGQKWSH